MPFGPAPLKPPISFTLLSSVAIQVGTIEAVSEVPNSKKLLALTANFGDHKRTILSAMKAERPNPQELVGRQTLFVVNLEPKAMAGMVSDGMVLDLGYADGLLPALALPERPLPDGVRAG
jgi:tRNA-binding protein